jgi:hypothetical protein
MQTFWAAMALAILVIITAGVVLAVNCALAIYDYLEGGWFKE